MSETKDTTRTDDEIMARGKQVYEERLKSHLEPEHTGRFVAIEPESGRHFIGETHPEALDTAREKMPEKRFYVKHVGSHSTHKSGS